MDKSNFSKRGRRHTLDGTGMDLPSYLDYSSSPSDDSLQMADHEDAVIVSADSFRRLMRELESENQLEASAGTGGPVVAAAAAAAAVATTASTTTRMETLPNSQPSASATTKPPPPSPVELPSSTTTEASTANAVARKKTPRRTTPSRRDYLPLFKSKAGKIPRYPSGGCAGAMLAAAGVPVASTMPSVDDGPGISATEDSSKAFGNNDGDDRKPAARNDNENIAGTAAVDSVARRDVDVDDHKYDHLPIVQRLRRENQQLRTELDHVRATRGEENRIHLETFRIVEQSWQKMCQKWKENGEILVQFDCELYSHRAAAAANDGYEDHLTRTENEYLRAELDIHKEFKGKMQRIHAESKDVLGESLGNFADKWDEKVEIAVKHKRKLSSLHGSSSMSQQLTLCPDPPAAAAAAADDNRHHLDRTTVQETPKKAKHECSDKRRDAKEKENTKRRNL